MFSGANSRDTQTFNVIKHVLRPGQITPVILKVADKSGELVSGRTQISALKPARFVRRQSALLMRKNSQFQFVPCRYGSWYLSPVPLAAISPIDLYAVRFRFLLEARLEQAAITFPVSVSSSIQSMDDKLYVYDHLNQNLYYISKQRNA